MRTTYLWHVGQQSTIPAIPSYSNTTAVSTWALQDISQAVLRILRFNTVKNGYC